MHPAPNLGLSGSHRRTYDTIFQHPVTHNLAWHDVFAMLRQLGEVDEQPNGNLRVIRHGLTLVLHPVRTKEVSTTEEVLALRHFLDRSETAPPATAAAEPHWLLLIDHHQARIFLTDLAGEVPQVAAHRAEYFFRPTPHAEDFSRGQEKPDANTYFEPVAQTLQAAGRILIFGTGTGGGSEMTQFIAWTKVHHPALAGRIDGSLTVDEHHLTDGQLLAKAREFYASSPAGRP